MSLNVNRKSDWQKLMGFRLSPMPYELMHSINFKIASRHIFTKSKTNYATFPLIRKWFGKLISNVIESMEHLTSGNYQISVSKHMKKKKKIKTTSKKKKFIENFSFYAIYKYFVWTNFLQWNGKSIRGAIHCHNMLSPCVCHLLLLRLETFFFIDDKIMDWYVAEDWYIHPLYYKNLFDLAIIVFR